MYKSFQRAKKKEKRYQKAASCKKGQGQYFKTASQVKGTSES